MLSPLKIALFAFISFATLALAIPTSEAQANYKDPKVAIYNANVALRTVALPLVYVTRDNATSDCLGPVIDAITETVVQLNSELRLASLSACGCSAGEIVELIAVTLEIIFYALYNAYALYPGLGSLLSQLVFIVVELLEIVLALVGGLVHELLFLLIGNGCAGVILKLNLSALIHVLGLGGLLGII